jgi:hypothetical protein
VVAQQILDEHFMRRVKYRALATKRPSTRVEEPAPDHRLDGLEMRAGREELVEKADMPVEFSAILYCLSSPGDFLLRCRSRTTFQENQ